MPVKHRVLCYIVQAGRLVVFRHVGQRWEESGLQVPAGTIKPTETPEAAALREASEETGLVALRVVQKLGEAKYDMRPYRRETHHRHVFHLHVDELTPERWFSQEADPDGGSAPVGLECFWIPLAQGHALSAGQGALLGGLET